jgi:hypothetical protein
MEFSDALRPWSRGKSEILGFHQTKNSFFSLDIWMTGLRNNSFNLRGVCAYTVQKLPVQESFRFLLLH